MQKKHYPIYYRLTRASKGIMLCMVLFLFAAESLAQVSGYSFRKRLETDNTQVSGTTNMAEFPVLVDLTHNDLRTVGNGGQVQNSNGYDIVFTGSDGSTVLNHQLESYDAVNGRVVAWVRLPTLQATANTLFYIYYGNPAISTNPSTTNTWSAGYQMVHHYQTDLNDGTSLGNNGTNSGTSSTAGKIGNGRLFNGSDFISVADDASLDITGDLTMSLWVNPVNVGDGPDMITKGAWNDAYTAYIRSNGDIRTTLNGGRQLTSNTSLANNNWYHIVVTKTSGQRVIYINGVPDATSNNSTDFDTNNDPLYLSSNGFSFNGIMDEVRVMNTVPPADWVATEFNNQDDPANFISIIPEPPVLSGIEGTPQVFSAGGSAVNITNSITASDLFYTQLQGATVQITGNYNASEDLLDFTGSGGITGLWDSGTGTMTLSGTASITAYETALRNVTYVNTNGSTPDQSTRTISFTVSNGSATSAAVTRDLNILTDLNDPSADIPNVVFHFDGQDIDGDLDTGDQPADGSTVGTWNDRSFAATGGSSTDLTFTGSAPVFNSIYFGERGAVNFDGGDQLARASDNLLNTNTFTEKSFAAAFRTGSSVAGLQIIYEQGAGARGYQISIKDGIAYAYTWNHNEWGGGNQDKSISLGVVQPNESYIVVASHDATAGTLTGRTWSATLNGGSLQQLTSADIQQAHGGAPAIGAEDGSADPVTFAGTPGNGTASASFFEGYLAELISWNTALSGGQMADVFTYLDDKWSNAAPVLAGIEVANLDYNEGDPGTAITSTLTVSDGDNTVMEGAAVTISGNYRNGEDILQFTDTPNITGSWDSGSGVLTLTGPDTRANYQTALRSVEYNNIATGDPTAGVRQVDFEVTDWDDTSNSVSRNINVITVDDPPVLANIEGADLAYTEDDGQSQITSNITVSDDGNLQSATIQITGNYIQGEDLLDFTDTGNITSSFNATNGTLTLSGTATIAEYEIALRAVTYENDSPDPVTLDRTVSFTVYDGTNSSNTRSRDITVASVNSAPILAGTESSALVYGAGDPPTAITNTITTADYDNSDIESATIQITGNYDDTQDVLGFSTLFGITGSWDAPSGTLTLTGTAGTDDYQTALRTVTYENTGGNPSVPQRTVSFTINDGVLNSNTVTRNVTVSIPGAISGMELWLRGDTGTLQNPGGSPSGDGQDVGEWQDQSGNGRHFSAPGTAPRLSNTVSFLNNQPAIEFNGNGDFLEDENGEDYINGLSEFTIFVVIKSDQTDSDRGFWNAQIPDTQDDIFTLRYDAQGATGGAVNLVKTGILNDVPDNQLESFSDVQTTNGQIVMLQWESGNLFDLFVDGVLNNPSAATTPPSGAISGATRAIVGKGGKDDPDTPGRSWDGMIAEVILYGRDLTQTERMSVEDYLSEKYDIPIRLLTPATGGEAISADDANTTFTPLTGPVIREEIVGKLQDNGTIVLRAPAGYEWDTGGSDPTAGTSPAFGGQTNLQIAYTGRTASEITFTVTQPSSSPNAPGKVTFGGLRVRPTTGMLPNTGNITNVGTTGQGGTTNYGTLAMVAGNAAGLTFSQQPTTNNISENITPPVRLQLVDQYGNNVQQESVSIDIALTSGTGNLSGTTSQLTNTLGIAEFANLQIDQTGTGKQLTASSSGLNSVISNTFDIVIAGEFTTFMVERVPSGNITPKTAGQNFDIRISAVDGNGTVDTDFNGTASISSTGTLGSGGGTTGSFTSGVLASHTISITSVGNVKITATNSSGSETGESNEFPVSPGSASESTSLISANPMVILNDGISTSTITAQLKDGFGNNLTTGGATVNLVTDNGSLGTVIDNGDGTYTAILTSSTSQGTATITGAVNGNSLSDNAEVEFALFDAIWIGQLGSTDVASDWNLGVNWSGGTVPGPGDIILIPADPAVGNEYPVIDISGQSVDEVSIETGADLTITGGVNFTITGNLSGGGEINGANNDSVTVGGDISMPDLPIGTVVLNGSSKQTVSAPHTYTNLTIDNAAGVDVNDDLFVNNTLVLSDGTLTIPSGKNLIANTKATGSGQLAFRRNISGITGWRMISSPVNTTFGDLLGGTLTQGYPGAFYDSGSSPGDTLQPNVLWYEESIPGTDNQRYRAPVDASDPITAGQGLFVYVFGDVNGDPLYDNALPDTLLATGQEHEGDGTEFDFNVTYTAAADTGWNFVGNPFGATLNWNGPGWTKTNIDNTIYVWDPEANGGEGEYLTWNGSTGTLGSGLIAPFQGFWVKANGPGAVLKVNKSNKTTGGNFLRKTGAGQQNETQTIFPIMQFTASFEGMSGRTNLVFQNGAEAGKDINDGYRLLPFSETFMEIYTMFDDGTQLAVNNLPRDFDTRMLIPLDVGGYIDQEPISGSITITWDGLRNIPNDWILTLVDHQTGNEIDMLGREDYTFEINSANKQRYSYNTTSGTFRLKENNGSSTRFTIRVSTEQIEAEIPGQVYLAQNYPNPFNRATTIEFGLSEDTNVTLEVYDILGRRIQTLISDRLGAGVYTTGFNARELASGVYIYRLIAGERTYVKKFTFIK